MYKAILADASSNITFDKIYKKLPFEVSAAHIREDEH